MAKIKGQLRRIYGDYAPNISERIVEVEGLKLFPEHSRNSFRNWASSSNKKRLF